MQLTLTDIKQHALQYAREAYLYSQYNSRLTRVFDEFSDGISLRWYQRKFFKWVEAYQNVAITASRQVGKSEGIIALAKTWALAFKNSVVVVASSGLRHSKELLKRLKNRIFGSKTPIPLKTQNTSEIELFNGSRIISIPNNPDTIRGYPCNLLIIDEADSIRNPDQFAASVFPSVWGVGGKIVVSGTFKGIGFLHRLIYGDKAERRKPWNGLMFPAWVVWARKEDRNLIMAKKALGLIQQAHDLPTTVFNQEFLCEAMDIAGTLFPYDYLDACTPKDKYGKPLINSEDRSVNFNSVHFGGWDPAKLLDGSCLANFELPDTKMAKHILTLRFIQDLGGRDYPSQVTEIGELHKLWKFFKIVVDRTGPGEGPLDYLKKEIGTHAKGVFFTPQSKLDISSDFRIAVMDREVYLPFDSKLRRELHDLDPIKLDHPVGGSSDRAWATMLAWHGYEYYMRSYIYDPKKINFAESEIKTSLGEQRMKDEKDKKAEERLRKKNIKNGIDIDDYVDSEMRNGTPVEIIKDNVELEYRDEIERW